MAWRIFGLKNCDTCRKALKTLAASGRAVELVDLRESGVPEALMVEAYEQFGAALLNTRSTTWRGLDEAERAGTPLELIARHPALMKRPLIEADGVLYLGWGKDVQSELA